jgi:hypothetical protein
MLTNDFCIVGLARNEKRPRQNPVGVHLGRCLLAVILRQYCRKSMNYQKKYRKKIIIKLIFFKKSPFFCCSSVVFCFYHAQKSVFPVLSELFLEFPFKLAVDVHRAFDFVGFGFVYLLSLVHGWAT